MKRMLINARYPEEIRVAVVNNGCVEDLRIENQNLSRSTLANIYQGTIGRIEPSLNAVFVDYGAARHGFLPFKDIAPQSLPKHADGESIATSLKEGDHLIVQIEKEERGNKGAALTTYISIAGSYLVLMPYKNEGSIGISKQLSHIKKDLLEETKKLKIPGNVGVTLRTAGGHLSAFEWQQDLDHQFNTWKSVLKEAANNKSPCFLFQESNIIVKSIRDSLAHNIEEILVDHKESYELAKEMVHRIDPKKKKLVEYYSKPEPIFDACDIENQVSALFNNRVALPSGGSIVIDTTEALTAIDVNSQSTKGTNIEETAHTTNLEAAEEIVRQCSIRDIGGLIVVDFIDMEKEEYRSNIYKKMKDALEKSRARSQVGPISNLGLMEISRQRVRSSLMETTHQQCRHCNGLGDTQTDISIAIKILRDLQQSLTIHKHLQVTTSTAISNLLNKEKKSCIEELEKSTGGAILVKSKGDFLANQYEIKYCSTQNKMVILVSAKKNKSISESNHRFVKPLVNIRDTQPTIARKSIWSWAHKMVTCILLIVKIFDPQEKNLPTIIVVALEKAIVIIGADILVLRAARGNKIYVRGGVAEWSKALVLKTSVSRGTQGSNPCPSANFHFFEI